MYNERKMGKLYSSTIVVTLALLGAALMPTNPRDIFSTYEDAATQKVQTMSEDEKIGQILLVRYPGVQGVQELERYQFGGYVFFEQDFISKNVADVQKMMADLQTTAKIPILTAVDEEGGLVVRVSSNGQLAPARFASSQYLYNTGGFEAISEDTVKKSELLDSLGINLNLAPVVDVSVDSDDYMYDRSIGQNTEITSEYAKTVIKSSSGTGVSYTLKHFPGYGNNIDTHRGIAKDDRLLEEILENDLLPFHAGIDAGAEAVLVSHNIVNSIDSENPASLSPKVHEILRGALGFTGVVITDDIAMGALDQYGNTTVEAILAGNDLIITTDYLKSIEEIRAALKDGRLNQTRLDEAVKRVVAWKYYKGILKEELFFF